MYLHYSKMQLFLLCSFNCPTLCRTWAHMGLLGVCLIWYLSSCARLYSIGCENNSLQLLQGPHAEQGEMYTYPGTTSNQFKSTGVYLCLLAPSPGHCRYYTMSSHLNRYAVWDNAACRAGETTRRGDVAAGIHIVFWVDQVFRSQNLPSLPSSWTQH